MSDTLTLKRVVDLVTQADIDSSVYTIIDSVTGAVKKYPIGSLICSIAPIFDATAAYAAGKYCNYNGQLYQFDEAHAAGPWTGSDATAVTLSELLEAIGADVDDLKEALTSVDNALNPLFVKESLTDWAQYPFKIADTAVGSILDITDLGTSNNYYRQLVECSKDDVFELCSYAASSVGQYAFLDAEYKIFTKDNVGSSTEVKRVTAPANGYLAFQGHKNYTRTLVSLYKVSASVQKYQGTEHVGKTLVVGTDGYVEVEDNPVSDDVFTKITATKTDGYYINTSGEKTANNSNMLSDPIYIEAGSKLLVYARGYRTATCIIAQTHLGSNNYYPLVICVDSTARWYTLEIVRSGYYVLSGNKDTPFIVYTLPSKQYDTNDVSLSMFQKFGVIGDSYASGVIYTTWGTSQQRYACSWGQIMARKFGTVCTNYSSGGLSTRTWLTHANGLTKLLASDPDDIYYCALGINDYSQLGEEYLGTISDINDSDPSLNEDTFYGNYGKIITNIKSHAPHALIVMFTCANTGEVPTLFNNAIIEIANHYAIPYIVQAEDQFFKSNIYTHMLSGHPTSIAYGGMCNAFERLLQGAIQLYRDYFENAYKYLDE